MNTPKIVKSLSDNAAFTFEFDVSTGMVEEDIIGSTGTSNAIQIARRLGLKKEIVDDADSMLSEESKSFDKVLMSAEKARKTAEELTEQAKIHISLL